jgi:hypothetical protein
MTPVGYMAKRVGRKPDWKHNGFWFFDSPEIIRDVAKENSISLEGTSLFYYEAHEMEFDGDHWGRWSPEPSFPTNVIVPSRKQLEGFEVVNFTAKTSPECSGLSCSSLAAELPRNRHCLFSSFEEAETRLNDGSFENAEPGPYRIFALYSVDWT